MSKSEIKEVVGTASWEFIHIQFLYFGFWIKYKWIIICVQISHGG